MASSRNENGRGTKKGEKEPPQANRIIEMVLNEGVTLFHDQTGKSYACLPVNSHRQVWPVDGRQFRAWISGKMWDGEQNALRSESLNAALNVIRSKAIFGGEQRELHNRVAFHGGSIWYDLGDPHWRAIRVTSQGWKTIKDPPILFKRYSHQDAQVEPARPGCGLHELLRFVNVGDGYQKLLLMVYLVTCLVPDIPHPVIVLHGPQGSAKTTALRVLRRLVDPSRIEVLTLTGDIRELVQQVAHHWMAYFDNVSRIPLHVSDSFCRAVTGDGLSKRQLYTDDDDVTYEYRRCVGISGVNIAAYQPDLLDRCIVIGLERIDESIRKTEQEFWDEFERLRPHLVAGMLNVLARAMALYGDVNVPNPPRMADFARWGCAVTAALGRDPDDFLRAYEENASLRNEEVLESDVVAKAMEELVKREGKWEGSASELVSRLEGVADELRISIKAKSWPRGPSALVRRLNVLKTNLAKVGIHIDRGRGSKRRQIRIWTDTAPVRDETVESDIPDWIEEQANSLSDDGNDGIESMPSQMPSQRKACNYAGSSGYDGNDGISPTLEGDKQDKRKEGEEYKGSENAVTRVIAVTPRVTPAESRDSDPEPNDGIDDDISGSCHSASQHVLPARTSDWPEWEREMYEERAAIMEFEGELSSEDAQEWAETKLREIFAGQTCGDTQGE